MERNRDHCSSAWFSFSADILLTESGKDFGDLQSFQSMPMALAAARLSDISGCLDDEPC
jgi:hypothetical protein